MGGGGGLTRAQRLLFDIKMKGRRQTQLSGRVERGGKKKKKKKRKRHVPEKPSSHRRRQHAAWQVKWKTIPPVVLL